jgi:hypothetical protein
LNFELSSQSAPPNHPKKAPPIAKIKPRIAKKVKKNYRKVLLFKKIILSLCYEDCEPTYKSSLKTLDLIVFSAPHRRPELHQRTGRLQGPSSGLSSLNY